MAELARRGHEATAVVRDAARLQAALPAAHVVEMDLASVGADAFRLMGSPDVLIHLAWDGLPNYRSLAHFETELPAQYGFLKAMVEAGLPDLLVTGTCFEYGMQSGPLSETAASAPCNPYGFAKDSLLRQLNFLKATHPFRLTWARLFYVFGEGQHKGSIYPLLKEAVLRGDEAFDMSAGEQLRDYIAVDEVARSLAMLAETRLDIGPVNVCSGKPVSLRNLVEGWLREKGWRIRLNLGHYPYPDHEPMAFWGVRDRLDSIQESSRGPA